MDLWIALFTSLPLILYSRLCPILLLFVLFYKKNKKTRTVVSYESSPGHLGPIVAGVRVWLPGPAARAGL